MQGKVLLVRAPTIDTGDIQFATAVGVPPPGAERFAHLPNVVIFSTQGEQPLISSLARGDMDGDLVSVIYDTRLFPKRTEPAMIHQAKTPVLLNRDCNIGDVIDFALRFFRNDILGKISNRVRIGLLAPIIKLISSLPHSISLSLIKRPRVSSKAAVLDTQSAGNWRPCMQLRSMVSYWRIFQPQ